MFDPTRSGTRYEPLDFFLLRAPAHPIEAALELTADPAGEPTDDERLAHTRRLLRGCAADPDVRRALTTASPDLGAALERPRADPDATQKKTRRAYSRLLRYLSRMATRPTPFGAFSGIALGRFADATGARLGPTALRPAGRVRVDMAWLLALVKQLEADERIRCHLPLVVNAIAQVRGDRVLLPSFDVHGGGATRSVRIRWTPAVDAVFQLADTPVIHAALIDELASRFPQVDRPVVAGLIDEMWQLGFLTADLRPPLDAIAPERYLLKHLVGVPTAEPVVAAIEEISDLVDRATAGEPGAIDLLVAAQRALVGDHTGPTYQLDTALDAPDTTVDREIGRAVAEGVDCLMRLSSAVPGHNHHLARYRDAFMERYGAGALVPVLEVLSPEHGLDARRATPNLPAAMHSHRPMRRIRPSTTGCSPSSRCRRGRAGRSRSS